MYDNKGTVTLNTVLGFPLDFWKAVAVVPQDSQLHDKQNGLGHVIHYHILLHVGLTTDGQIKYQSDYPRFISRGKHRTRWRDRRLTYSLGRMAYASISEIGGELLVGPSSTSGLVMERG